MDRFEMTEKLREKTNVTYEEAKAALEACDWDLLEAIVHLENQGRLREEKTTELPGQETKKETKTEKGAGNVGKAAQNAVNFVGNMVEKGNRNALEVHRDNKVILSLPLTVLVLLMLLFWITIPAMIVSLFFGCRYRFVGKDISPKVNDTMDSVANKAEEFKDSIRPAEKE